MRVHLQNITVPYDYPVYFTRDVFSPENPALVEAVTRKEPLRRHRLLVLVETGVLRAWPRLLDDVRAHLAAHAPRLVPACDPLPIDGGEQVKNDPGCVARLHERLHALGMDRQSFVVIVGGGALLDMAGYAAATTHRGLRVVRVPTTVLAQTDSGVSVKNGVNAFGQKNFFGTFAPPFAVLNDSRLLESLSPRDMRAGMAEAVKVALIRDAGLFAWLERNVDALAACEAEPLAELVRRGAEIHLEHIAGSGDPFELGSARPLDFGHWAAHKLETLSRHRLRHGEAVAIGVVLDTRYSVEADLLPAVDADAVATLLERLGFRLWDDALALVGAGDRPLVLDGLADFREHLGGELTVTLLAAVGRGIEVHEMREDLVRRALAWLRTRDAGR